MSQEVVEAIDQNLLIVSFVEQHFFSSENHSMMTRTVVDRFFHWENILSLIRNFLYLISMIHFRENVEVNSLQLYSVEDDWNKKHVRRGQALWNFIFLHWNSFCVSIIRVNRSDIFIIDRDRIVVSPVKVLSTLLKPVWSYTKNTYCHGISKNEHLFTEVLKLLHFPAKQKNTRLNVLCKSCPVLSKLLEYQIVFDE